MIRCPRDSTLLPGSTVRVLFWDVPTSRPRAFYLSLLIYKCAYHCLNRWVHYIHIHIKKAYINKSDFNSEICAQQQELFLSSHVLIFLYFLVMCWIRWTLQKRVVMLTCSLRYICLVLLCLMMMSWAELMFITQIEEIEALSSIYGEEWCVIDEASRVFCIRISDDTQKPTWTVCLQVYET